MLTKKKKDRSKIRPVRNIEIEVSEDKKGLRIVLLIACLIIAFVAFGIGINTLLSSDSGWQQISVNTTSLSCGNEFTFLYDIGTTDLSASKEVKAIRAVYTDVCVEAYEVYNCNSEFDDCNNVWYISNHLNEIVEVNSHLYDAFALIYESGTRYLYTAPITSMYVSLLYSQSDYEALTYDPYYDDDLRSFYLELSEYICNPNHINIELLGDNKVRLNVSDEYIAFANEYDINEFIDFSWMKNAFIADWIADELIENGYTLGTIISEEGYIRCLDSTSSYDFAFTLNHRDGTNIYDSDVIAYTGLVSVVYFHDYPTGSTNNPQYYTYESGEIRSMFIDPSDGLSKSSIPEITATSLNYSCSELALLLAPIFISDEFDISLVENLSDLGAAVYYYDDGELVVTGS